MSLAPWAPPEFRTADGLVVRCLHHSENKLMFEHLLIAQRIFLRPRFAAVAVALPERRMTLAVTGEQN